MRILTVVRTLNRGGTERAAVTYSLGYASAGHEVMVLATEEGGVRASALESAGVPVLVSDGGALISDELMTQIRAFGPEIIHLHRPGMTDPKWGHWLRQIKTAGAKAVETNVFGRADYSQDADLFDAHFHLSRWCLWRWCKWLPRKSKAVGVVLPYPVDVQAFHRATDEAIRDFKTGLGIPADAFTIGRIGQRSDGKWHPCIIDAFAEVARKDPQARLITIGMPEICRNRLAQLPQEIQERAVDLGYIDDDAKLATAYSAMDVFVAVAEIGETFGYVMAEAMLCGTPVVTASRPHKDNSQVEVVGHQIAGLVGASTDAVPSLVRQLHQDSELRARLSGAAREAIVSRFESSFVADSALLAMEHAVAAKDQNELRERLEGDSRLVTLVTDGEIDVQLSGLFGRMKPRERVLFRALTMPGAYRFYRHIKALARG